MVDPYKKYLAVSVNWAGNHGELHEALGAQHAVVSHVDILD